MILLLGILGLMLCGSMTCIIYPQLFTNHLYHYLFVDDDDPTDV